MTGRTLSITVALASALVASGVRGQLVPPTPAPAPHGGYGSATISVPAYHTPGSASPSPTPARPNWIVVAEAHLGECSAEVLKRSNAMDAAWGNAEAKIDARARELLRQGGFSDSDIASFYKPPTEPENYASFYRPFYSAGLAILTHASLRDVSNPSVFSEQNTPCYPFGCEPAVGETMAALDRDMEVFRVCDGYLGELLGLMVERDARYRFLRTDENRNSALFQQAKSLGDTGPYTDPANTAERAKARPLEYRDRMLIGRNEFRSNATLARDIELAGWELQLLRDLPTFGEFDRLARRRTYAMAVRTAPLVPLAQVVQRVHGHVRDLARRGGVVARDPVVERWYVYPGAFFDFCQRQSDALGNHLKGWYQRRGATEEELAAMDAQMKASEAVDAPFQSQMKQMAAMEQQMLPLQYREQDLEGEIGDLAAQAAKLSAAGDHADADALGAQMQALGKQDRALQQTSDALLSQDTATEKADDAKTDADDFILPDTTLRVAWVEFDFMTEPEPRKDANPVFPLMGAPVHLWLTRNIPETSLGVPMTVQLFYTLEKGDAPATQALNLTLGGAPAPLTLYLSNGRYLSANVILEP